MEKRLKVIMLTFPILIFVGFLAFNIRVETASHTGNHSVIFRMEEQYLIFRFEEGPPPVFLRCARMDSLLVVRFFWFVLEYEPT